MKRTDEQIKANKARRDFYKHRQNKDKNTSRPNKKQP